MRGHSILALHVGIAVVVAASLGCSAKKNALQQHLADLEDEVLVLQKANERLEERLITLELERTQSAVRASEEKETPERPDLQVVKLGPEPSSPAGEKSSKPTAKPAPQTTDAQEEESRPLIHGSGEAVETKMPGGPTSERLPQPNAGRAVFAANAVHPSQRDRE